MILDSGRLVSEGCSPSPRPTFSPGTCISPSLLLGFLGEAWLVSTLMEAVSQSKAARKGALGGVTFEQSQGRPASVLAAISSQTPVSLCCHLLLSISHWVVCSVLASKCPHIPRTMFWEGSTSRNVIDGADPGWKKSHIRTTLTSQVSVSRP